MLPHSHLLYPQPFCEFLVLKAQISNPFFISDLFEQVGESICDDYQPSPAIDLSYLDILRSTMSRLNRSM